MGRPTDRRAVRPLAAALLAALLAGLAGGPAAAQGPAPSLREQFGSADKNGDGRIDREEFYLRITEVFYLRDGNRDGYLVITEMEGVSPEVLRAADRNGDGRLSLPEFINARVRDFEAADTDGDGTLVLDEVEAYRNRAPR